ncbi:unnamed protein product [Sphagnum tenellum]
MSRYSTVVIEINTDNAAFEDDAGAEVARILRELATRYENEGYQKGIALMTQTIQTRYVVNRLRVNRENTDKVLVTKVSGDVEEGIKQGTIIEDRGTTAARFSFVGQLLSNHPRLDVLDRGHGIADHVLFEMTGVDVRHMGR